MLRRAALLAFVKTVTTIANPSASTTNVGASLIGLGLSIAVTIVCLLSGQVPGLTPSAAPAMLPTVS